MRILTSIGLNLISGIQGLQEPAFRPPGTILNFRLNNNDQRSKFKCRSQDWTPGCCRPFYRSPLIRKLQPIEFDPLLKLKVFGDARIEEFSFSCEYGTYKCKPRNLDDHYVYVCSEPERNLVIELNPFIKACKIIPFETPQPHWEENLMPLDQEALNEVNIGVKICEALELHTQYVVRLNPFGELVEADTLGIIGFKPARRYVYPVGTESPAIALKPKMTGRSTLDISFDAGIHSVPVTSSATWNGISWKDDEELASMFEAGIRLFSDKRVEGRIYLPLGAHCHTLNLSEANHQAVDDYCNNKPMSRCIKYVRHLYRSDTDVEEKEKLKSVLRFLYSMMLPNSLRPDVHFHKFEAMDDFIGGICLQTNSSFDTSRYQSHEQSDNFYTYLNKNLWGDRKSSKVWSGLVDLMTPEASDSKRLQSFLNGTVLFIDAVTSPEYWKVPGIEKQGEILNVNSVIYPRLLSALGRCFVRGEDIQPEVRRHIRPSAPLVRPPPFKSTSMTESLYHVPENNVLEAGRRHYSRAALIKAATAKSRIIHSAERRRRFFDLVQRTQSAHYVFRISGVMMRETAKITLCFKCNDQAVPDTCAGQTCCRVAYVSSDAECVFQTYSSSRILGISFSHNEPNHCEILYIGERGSYERRSISSKALGHVAIGFCRIQGFTAVQASASGINTRVKGVPIYKDVLYAVMKGATFYSEYGFQPDGSSTFGDNANYTVAGMVKNDESFRLGNPGPILATGRLGHDIRVKNALPQEDAAFYMNEAIKILYNLKIDCNDNLWKNCYNIFPKLRLQDGRCAFHAIIEEGRFIQPAQECIFSGRVGDCLASIRSDVQSTNETADLFIQTYLQPLDLAREYQDKVIQKSTEISDDLFSALRSRFFEFRKSPSSALLEAWKVLSKSVVFLTVSTTTELWAKTYFDETMCKPAWAIHHIKTSGSHLRLSLDQEVFN